MVRLGGKARLPLTPPPYFGVKPNYDPSFKIDETAAARGRELWLRNCSVCHTPGGGNANWPDLRESVMAHDYETLRTIVRDGALSARGMPKFDDLTDEQVRDIHMAVHWYSKQAALGETVPMEERRQF